MLRHLVRVALVTAFCVVMPLVSRVSAQDLRRTSDQEGRVAEFRVVTDGDFLVVPVTLEGVTVQMILDTGATNTIFDQSLRPHLGRRKRVDKVMVPSGEQSIEVFNAAAAQMGPIQLPTSSEIVCCDMSQVSKACGYNIYGCIGMDCLNTFIVSVDFDQGRLSFYQPGTVVHGRAIPLRCQAGRPFVSLELDHGKAHDFLVDTGSSDYCAGSIQAEDFKSLLARGTINERESRSQYLDLSRINRVKSGVIEKLFVGGFQVDNLYFKNHVGTFPNYLGLGFWKRFCPTFDFPGQKVYLRPSVQFWSGPEHNLSGLHVQLVDGRYIVQSIDTGSAAARANISPGDVITSVNGTASGQVRLHALNLMLCREIKNLELTIRRADSQAQVSLELKR